MYCNLILVHCVSWSGLKEAVCGILIRRKCTFNPYILTFFHFSPYILFLPLLVSKPINAGHLSP